MRKSFFAPSPTSGSSRVNPENNGESTMKSICIGLSLVLACLIAAPGKAIEDKEPTKQGVQKKPQKSQKKAGTFLDAKGAGLDYEIQGEYTGSFASGAKLGCQVIALGNGHFQAVLLPGGLPGDGWNGGNKYLMDGKLDGAKAIFEPATGKRNYMAGSPKEFSATAKFPPKGHQECSGLLVDGTLSGKCDDGASFALKKILRTSPTLNAKPPEGAVVLFDGSNANEWKEGRIVNGLLPVAANSKRTFKDFKLHIEFRLPFQPTARSQGRGNSGVYLHAKHEIQVLDSFGLEGKSDECGGFYGRKAPNVNMCFPPLTWQTYDVELKSGSADPKSKKQTARVTVLHNGVKIHENLEFPSGEGHLHLQNHGNPVFYRNIWVVELK
jgi:hypothetical protein